MSKSKFLEAELADPLRRVLDRDDPLDQVKDARPPA
jgi:hypothetical protein